MLSLLGVTLVAERVCDVAPQGIAANGGCGVTCVQSAMRSLIMYECAAAVAAFQGSIPLTATAGHHGAQTAEMVAQKSKWVQTNTAKEKFPNQTAEIVWQHSCFWSIKLQVEALAVTSSNCLVGTPTAEWEASADGPVA